MSSTEFVNALKDFDGDGVERMLIRHRFLVQSFLPDLEGARILYLSDRDRMMSYALASVGASDVLGIVSRTDNTIRLRDFADQNGLKRIPLEINGFLEGLKALKKRGAVFDVVILGDVLDRTASHSAILAGVSQLGPKLIIVDGVFTNQKLGAIKLVAEPQEGDSSNEVDGLDRQIIGILSVGAMHLLAKSFSYDCTWSNWEELDENDRETVRDYFKPGPQRRRTCSLRLVR